MPAKTAKADGQSRQQVRKYFARLQPKTRKQLKELAGVIHKAAPGSEETISYSIPAIRLNGRIVVWYAGWKDHLSMYPLTAEDRKFADAKGYKTAKGTVQFPLGERLPVSLIRRLVKSRVAAAKAKKS